MHPRQRRRSREADRTRVAAIIIGKAATCSMPGRSATDRSGPPAVGAPNCTGGAVALAFAREGADVIISYLGSEEVDADETVR